LISSSLSSPTKPEAYIDGGFLINYPLNLCLENGCPPEEIFGIVKTELNNETTIDFDVSSPNTVFDYLFGLLVKVVKNVKPDTYTINNNITTKIPYEICIVHPNATIMNIIETARSVEKRIELKEMGELCAKEFIQQMIEQQQDSNADTDSGTTTMEEDMNIEDMYVVESPNSNSPCVDEIEIEIETMMPFYYIIYYNLLYLLFSNIFVFVKTILNI
jgi:hypothetical protein